MPSIWDQITIQLGMHPREKCNTTIVANFLQGRILGLLLDTARVEPRDYLQLRALIASLLPRIPQGHR